MSPKYQMGLLSCLCHRLGGNRELGKRQAVKSCPVLLYKDLNFYFQPYSGAWCCKRVCLNSWPEVGPEILDGESGCWFYTDKVQAKGCRGKCKQPLNCFILNPAFFPLPAINFHLASQGCFLERSVISLLKTKQSLEIEGKFPGQEGLLFLSPPHPFFFFLSSGGS